MTKAELLAAADALDQCFDEIRARGTLSPAATSYMAHKAHALRAQAAAMPDAEPFRYGFEDRHGRHYIASYHAPGYVPLYTAPPDQTAKIARMRELEESKADEACDKIMAMTDEQIKALCAFEGHHPDDEAQLGKQAIQIAALRIGRDKAKASLTTAVALLEDAATRMERARGILTDNNPRHECNWGMLDTVEIRAFLAAHKESGK